MNVLRQEKSKFVGVLSAILVLSLGVMLIPFAGTELGLSTGVATNLYNVVNIFGYGAAAAAIVSSAGLGTVGVTAIVAAVKKWGMKKFILW